MAGWYQMSALRAKIPGELGGKAKSCLSTRHPEELARGKGKEKVGWSKGEVASGPGLCHNAPVPRRALWRWKRSR